LSAAVKIRSGQRRHQLRYPKHSVTDRIF